MRGPDDMKKKAAQCRGCVRVVTSFKTLILTRVETPEGDVLRETTTDISVWRAEDEYYEWLWLWQYEKREAEARRKGLRLER